MTIADLMQVLRKHLIAAVAAFVVVVAAVAAFTFLSPAKYTATAELFAAYAAQSNSLQNSSEMSSGASYLSTQIKTYPQLVKTQAVLQPVIDELGLDTSVADLATTVTATNPTDTFMVDISVEARDAGQSASIANAVAKNLARQISSSLYTDSTGKSPITLSVVQKAQTPLSPSSPKVVLYLAAGFVLAVIVAIGVALLKDVLNTKVDNLDDTRELTGASSLGVVPQDPLLGQLRPAVISQPDGAESEEFRRICTNISFLNLHSKEGGQLLVISSTQPGEGKTTMAVNVAAALAEEGKSVLLIDADLRHPSVARKIGVEGHVGLSHVLSGQALPRDVVQKYWKPKFHVLPAGKRPANPSILLNSTIMREVVEQALLQYDDVILDTAPMTVANDATVFAKMADGIILVVGKGVAEKKELHESVQALHAATIPILGFVFNFADPKKIRAKNYYYYSDATGGAEHRERQRPRRK
ncbi:MAG: polysaccharide biosynthesis tyrosine autokinase [Bifidobacterium sp.]|nr:polysaccharide biosynthesis tyrosine autokinase [Bifidobacterium sp.]MCI1865338.1 polysaccharide biosynthesis tyrosine autokinase [Bifidobacterium sp.]